MLENIIYEELASIKLDGVIDTCCIQVSKRLWHSERVFQSTHFAHFLDSCDKIVNSGKELVREIAQPEDLGMLLC